VKCIQLGDTATLKKVKDGDGKIFILAEGFLTEDNTHEDYKHWFDEIESRYPDARMYRIFWAAKSKRNAEAQVKRAMSIRPFSLASAILGGTFNSWWREAKVEADLTGQELGKFLEAQENSSEVILLGHSLGGRLLIRCMEYLANRPSVELEAIIIAGSAIADSEIAWDKNKVFSTTKQAFNIFSTNDQVLKYLFRIGDEEMQDQIRSFNLKRLVACATIKSPIGLIGTSKLPFQNVDVSSSVPDHFLYAPMLGAIFEKIN